VGFYYFQSEICNLKSKISFDPVGRMVPLRGFIRQQVWKQILALNSRGGVYPRPLLFRRVGSNEALQNIKLQAPNYKQISNSNIEAPCSKQQGIFEM